MHEQQELPWVELVVEKAAREPQELIEAVWVQMMHVYALGLLLLGGVQVHDPTKLQM